jgi:membrane protein
MRAQIGRWVAFGQVISGRFTEHRGSLTAGGLAFFVALSIAPAAVVVGWIVGLIVTPDQVRQALTDLVNHSPDLVTSLKPFVDSIVGVVEQSSGSTVTVTSLISLVIAVYAASRMVYGLRLALNTTFGVPERYRGIMERVLASAITLIGLVCAGAVIITLTFVPRILEALGITDVQIFTGIWVVDWVIVAVFVWLGCRWLMNRVPNHRQRVPWLAPGPIVSALWIVAVSGGVGIYVHFSGTLGAAILIFGTALVALLWLYLCFVGLLMGAEIEADRQRRTCA